MFPHIQSLHSYWAYLVVLVMILATINALVGLLGKKSFNPKDFRISLFGLIVTHLQLLIGFILYFMSPYFNMLLDMGMGKVMKDPLIRLYVVVHPTMMVLAVIFITMGYSKHKKELTSKGKFKKLLIFFGLGLAFILSRIPWAQWL